jgi:hypothetical protein
LAGGRVEHFECAVVGQGRQPVADELETVEADVELYLVGQRRRPGRGTIGAAQGHQVRAADEEHQVGVIQDAGIVELGVERDALPQQLVCFRVDGHQAVFALAAVGRILDGQHHGLVGACRWDRG